MERHQDNRNRVCAADPTRHASMPSDGTGVLRLHVLVALALTFQVTVAAAVDRMSFEGATGYFYAPSAEALTRGSAVLQYSQPLYFRGKDRAQDNLIAAFGLLPGLEVAGRIAWTDAHHNLFLADPFEVRDLSFSAKWRLPFIPERWLDLAVGAHDIGGEISYFDARYLMAGRRFGRFRLDLGYSVGDRPDGRLDGIVGGAQFDLTEWFSLLADHDGLATNAGVRINTPESWLPQGWKLQLTAQLYSDQDQATEDSFYALGLTIPLGGHMTRLELEPGKPVRREPNTTIGGFEPAPRAPSIPGDFAVATKTQSKPAQAGAQPASLLARRLADLGFEQVRVGRQENSTWVVSVENTLFHSNAADALGIVWGESGNSLPREGRVRILISRWGTPVFALESDLDATSRFFGTDDAPLPDVELSNVNSDAWQAVRWQAQAGWDSTSKPRLTIAPSLSSGVATEYGIWDYSLGLRANMVLNVFPGGALNVSHISAIDSSEDFDRDRVFYERRQRSGLSEANVQFTSQPMPRLFNSVYLGRFRYDYRGLMDEGFWQSLTGAHRLSLKAGHFEHESDHDDERTVVLAAYRYYAEQWNLSLEATAGQFWDKDTGALLEARFLFGDQSISLFYKNTDAEFVGVRLMVPLTPRRDSNFRHLQVRGKENWSHGIQTRINEAANTVSFGSADVPSFENESLRTFMNNDRLSPSYMRGQLLRMRDAYRRYAVSAEAIRLQGAP